MILQFSLAVPSSWGMKQLETCVKSTLNKPIFYKPSSFTILFLPTAILVSYTGAMTYMVHGDLIQCWSQTGSLMVDGFDNAWRWAQQFM